MAGSTDFTSPAAAPAEGAGAPTSAPPDGKAAPGRGDVYTMAEAARLKGVSYHTVSRAVRRGKLPVQRLGRMALVAADDLRDWAPMRERAPRKYRRREPNPEAAPALLDLASGERVELARRLSALYEVLHSAAGLLPLSDFLGLLCDRLAGALDFRRVALWGIDEGGATATRLATYGPPMSDFSATVALDAPAYAPFLAAERPFLVADVLAAGLGSPGETAGPRAVFGAPLRIGGRLLGFVFGDCAGDPIELSREQLDLAGVLATQAALALERAELRAAEAARADQLAAVLDDLTEAVCACDAAGRLTLSNAADQDLLGATEPFVPGRPMREVIELVRRRDLAGDPIAPEDTPLLRALRGERIADERYVVVRPDGDERLVRVNARPLGTGTPAGAIAVATDVTAEATAARQATERLAQLEASAARAEAVADVSVAVLSGADLKTVLQTTIARLVALLGGDSGALFFREADGRMVGQAGVRFDAPPAEEIVLDPAAVPTTMAAFARGAPVHYAYAEASPSERVYFDRYGFRSATIAPLIVGGEPFGVAYVNFAADDRRPSAADLAFAATLAGQCAVAIEKARLIERSEGAHRRLLTVVDQLPQGVIIAEAPDGRLVLTNRAAEGLLGAAPPATAAALAGLGDADGAPFPPDGGPLLRTLRTGEATLGEALTVSRADGTRITVLANHAPVLDAGGRIVGAVAVLQDLAQLRAIDRAKDEFLSVVAHELRNPLTSLRGNLQLLLRRLRREGDPARAEESDRLEAIIAQSDRMADLVNRLLDVSRADLGRLDLAPGPADAAAAVRAAVETARGLSKAHAFVAEAPDRAPVVWDALRIEQVLANLLSNAVKYSPGGEVSVTLTEPAPGRVRIAVRDHGPGIPAGAKPRLFERYFRAPDDGADGSEGAGGLEGLGLGLYISHRIAAAHGGDLTVEDAPGGGARFVLDLPREGGQGGEAARAAGNQAVQS